MTPETGARWLAALAGAGVGAAVGIGAVRAVRRLTADAAFPSCWRIVALQAALGAWGAVSAAGLWDAVLSLGLSAALLILALVDVRTMRLPNSLTLPLVGLGILFAGAGGLIMARCIGAIAGFLGLALLAAGFRRLRGRDGVGMGDAKLLGAAGAWLGWRALPWTVLLACGAAFVWIAVRAARHGRDALRQPLPFGAPLAMAFWIVWLYGSPQG